MSAVLAELTKIRTHPATWIAVGVAVLTALALRPITRTGPADLAPAYVLLVIPVFAAGTEYRAGQLRISLVAVPSRHRLFAAKLLATAAVTSAAALLTGLGASALAGLLLGLTGLGLAVLARSVVTPIVLLVALPVLVSPTLGGLFPHVIRFLPHEAALSLIGAGPLSRPAGLAVATTWAALAVGAGWATFLRRDS
ncbi:hypothetical protein [Actinoplanes sp. HUAS TT8]|uniref:hypothetical protein n=1 Tax=Actinoplanes sp. HUAS TT8 TaxID=3447453 RepID=UPI003F52398F